MKLHILSDLHLELFKFDPDPAGVAAADVIVLAGDIHKGTQAIPWARGAFPDKRILYVAGNHEYYDHYWFMLIKQLRAEARRHDVDFLENDAITIDGVRFLGTTLWTDFEFNAPSRKSQNMRLAENEMADYWLISPAVSVGQPHARLQASHTLARHQESIAWLKAELPRGDPDKTVVVTHHYPHRNSCAPRWGKDPMNAAFGSNIPLDVLFGATLWVHGHTHDSFDYQVKDAERSVRVVCNPRGYPPSCRRNSWENVAFNPALLVEISS